MWTMSVDWVFPHLSPKKKHGATRETLHLFAAAMKEKGTVQGSCAWYVALYSCCGGYDTWLYFLYTVWIIPLHSCHMAWISVYAGRSSPLLRPEATTKNSPSSNHGCMYVIMLYIYEGFIYCSSEGEKKAAPENRRQTPIFNYATYKN